MNNKNFDLFNGAALFLGLVILFGLGISACSSQDTVEVKDQEAARLSIKGYTVDEIHPKPGVTCFVVYHTGMSCLKD
jgi:hypothetical protein